MGEIERRKMCTTIYIYVYIYLSIYSGKWRMKLLRFNLLCSRLYKVKHDIIKKSDFKLYLQVFSTFCIIDFALHGSLTIYTV